MLQKISDEENRRKLLSEILACPKLVPNEAAKGLRVLQGGASRPWHTVRELMVRADRRGNLFYYTRACLLDPPDYTQVRVVGPGEIGALEYWRREARAYLLLILLRIVTWISSRAER